MALCAVTAHAAEGTAYTVRDFALGGEIEGENITFTLTFTAEITGKNVRLPLAAGDVAFVDGKLPKGAELVRDADEYALKIVRSGWFSGGTRTEPVVFRFASRPVKDGDWRRTSFRIPAASIRKLSVICDRNDLEVQFPGALNIQRDKTADNRTQVTAYLGLAGKFEVGWKPEVRKLSAELVVGCDANTIVSASVGALKIDNIFTYRVVQGTLKHVSFTIPATLNVTQVRGNDIQDWSIAEDPLNRVRTLNVTLSRPVETAYRLQVESEMILAKFPCDFELPVIAPQNVIRSSGFLMLGTDSAIKLLVNKAVGLTQVDQTSFPSVSLDPKDKAGRRLLPTRSRFAYQYANTPYAVTIAADDIVTEFSVDEQIVLNVKDGDLVFEASVELDVRDAPARDVAIETDPKWVVANVSGTALADYDVRDEGAKRVLYVYFREAVLGRTLVNLRLEQTAAEKTVGFDVPAFHLRGAKSERGYIVLAAEKGLRIREDKQDGLREVQTGSVESRVPNAQLAYRFKEAGWGLTVGVDRTQPTIHTEMFHLVSIGEGALYGSCSMTYHIDGAPVRTFKFFIPKEFQNVEFTGRDIRGWDHEGEIWTVSLQEKAIGDATLLLVYDRPFDAFKGQDISAGGIRTIETTSECGYIVMASSASLSLTQQSADPALTVIDRNEVPDAYLLLVNDPVLRAYKYTREPHAALVRVQRYETEALLDQVADHTEITSGVSKDGESVTKALYSIKNLSRQYLVLALPKGAKLWSTSVAQGHSEFRDVTTMQEGGKYLIPVARLRDPDAPVTVQVLYAQSQEKLGTMGRRLHFDAPVMQGSQSTFANWTFHVPEKYTIMQAGGNMSQATVFWSRGIARTAADVGRVWATVAMGLAGWLVLAVAAVVWAAWIAYRRARGVRVRWLAIGGIVVLAAGLVVVAAAQSGANEEAWDEIGGIFRANVESPTVLTLSKPLTLAGQRPLGAELRVVPKWVGADSALWLAAVLAGLGLVVLGREALRTRRSRLAAALGMTLLALGIAEMAYGRAALCAAFALGVPVEIARRGIRWSRRRGSERGGDGETGNRGGGETEGIEPFEEPEGPSGAGGSGGGAPVAGLLVAALTAAWAAGPLSAQAAETPPKEIPDLPTLTAVTLAVKAPAMERESERSAQVEASLEFQTANGGTYVLLRHPAVLTQYELGSRLLKVAPGQGGYLLRAEKGGKYRVTMKYSVPVTERNGTWSLQVDVPSGLRNRMTFSIPEKELDVESPEAVLFKVAEKENATEATAVYGSTDKATVVWRPRVRKTKLEKTVFFCELNTLAVFEAGVVDLSNTVRYQIAQGELKTLLFGVPAGMSVTAVRGEGLSTWRFDPAAGTLEAILEKAVSGDYTLQVVSQVPREGLPYEVTIGALQVREAARQRGSLALAVPDTVQIQVGKNEGLNPMNLEDVAEDSAAESRRSTRLSGPVATKRAFRYHHLPVTATVHAERILPEIRVTENAGLSVSDEIIKLSTQLGVNISRAGLFSLRLAIPEGYDVESLSCAEISHWDEVDAEGAATNAPAAGPLGGKKSRDVVVHFRKQALGVREINVVLARTEKGLDKPLPVPRVSVRGALKHSGTLVVSSERGVRMATVERDGISEMNPRELGIRETGVLAFKLLRPDWAIGLRAEVVAPTIRSEILQRVDLSEGMLQGTVYVRYRIDHAGCKRFRLQAPAPGVALAVIGRDVSRVHETSKAEGIWEVELHNKVENAYGLEIRYQVRDSSRVLPLRTLDVESQKGYLVVMSGGRAQVTPAGELTGMKQEDARAIPASFGAGDLSDAIYCYRTMGDAYELKLSVVRHEAAEVLPAEVTRTVMTSVVSDGGQVLTRVKMEMKVGNLRFLEMTLPVKESALWSDFFNLKAAVVSRKTGVYRIPLEEPVPGQPTTVEMMYASRVAGGWLTRKEEFAAPKFERLPLQNIQWTFYVAPGRRYYGFGGTLERQTTTEETILYDIESYRARNDELREEGRQKAQTAMAEVEKSAQRGEQRLAKKYLESAVNYSQGDVAFNEDARIQYRNLAKQQAVVGLVQRRDEMRFERNIQDVGQMKRMSGFKGGKFTSDYATEVQQSLSDTDNRSLLRQAEKIMDQQSAAERVAQAIHITMPEYGQRLTFRRSLQINPDAEMTVSFKSRSVEPIRWIGAAGVGLALLAMMRLLLAGRRAG